MKTALGILISIILLIIFLGAIGGTYYLHRSIEFSRVDSAEKSATP